MKEIINRTNEILSSFGLSIDETDMISERVMLTWHEHPEKIVEAIKQLGFEPLQADLAVEGVRIEH